LATVIALHWTAKQIGMPPSAALLIGGGALAFIPGLPVIALDPELALVLFLPPLLMDGAYFTAFGRFRQHLPGIISLALGAVVFTTFVVGLVTHWLLPSLPWAACFALGAIVSPPDAIAARAVLHGMKLPRRLQALLEGESLLNDATGLVLFRFAVAATLSGTFSAGGAIASFAFLAIGGGVVGLIIGAIWVLVLRRLGDDMLVVATSVLLCWVAYIAGEAVHVSGVIATVTAGLVFGWYQHVVYSATTRLQGNAFWRTMVFGLEALVFILMGFSLRNVLDRAGGLETVVTNLSIPIMGVILTVTAARFVYVFGSDALLRALKWAGLRRARPLGWRQAGVLGWAGMRGVVTLAVALTLPAAMPGRDLMLVAAFAVILVTVIVQGGTLGWVILLLRPVDADPPAPMTLPAAEAAVARVKAAAAHRLAHTPDGTLEHPQLLETFQKRASATERYAANAETVMDGLRVHFDLILAVIASGRAELLRLHRKGLIEDEVLHDLERDLDLEETGILYQRGD
jgi:CPA1 family monovalent cation:H+ antiporter